MIHLDSKGDYKYNQLKGIISPNVTCNVNAMCCAYECSDGKWSDAIKNYHTEYSRIPDKLVYFLRHEKNIIELYKLLYPIEYNNWILDELKDDDLYSDSTFPPNEILKILCMGFNIFVNYNNGDQYINCCELKELTIDEIKNKLDNGKAIVASFNLNGYGHIMTIVGYDEYNFFIEDSYGMKAMKEYEDLYKSKVMPIEDFKQLCKPKGDKKLVITF